MQQPSHIIIPEDCFQLLGSPSDQLSEILASSLENVYGCKCLFSLRIYIFALILTIHEINFISKRNWFMINGTWMSGQEELRGSE